MVLWNGNSNAMGQGSPQFTGSSPEIVPIDTTIKSKIPRPAPPEAPVTPPNLNLPGAGLPKLDMPAPSRPTSLVQSLLKKTDPNDPKYKMGIGGRIMGTVANFLSGMASRGPVVYTGKGAVNSRYYRDEADRLRQLDDARAQQDFWQQQNWGKPQQQAPANDRFSGNDEDNHESARPFFRQDI
jgi:hypothetical protein